MRRLQATDRRIRVRRLTAAQALACERAVEARCRCRCRGRLHGARRVLDELGLAGLLKGDPHFVEWSQPSLFGEVFGALAWAG